MSISVQNTVKILVCAALALVTTQFIAQAISSSTAVAAQRAAAASCAVVLAAPGPIPEIVVYAPRAGSERGRG
jgi:hypothetical protein